MVPGMKYRCWFLLSVAVFSWNAQAADWPPVVDQMVAHAKETIHLASLNEFKQVVDHPGDALIIDVREADEYETGHVPGAINIPRGVLEFRIWKQVGFPDGVVYGRRIYIYCKLSGRAALAAQSLGKLGFTKVTAVDMQIDDWAKAGYPLQ
jgi:rhodanese-related sulfurtransferase